MNTRKRVLNRVFGQAQYDMATFIDNVTKIHQRDGYELEMRIIDNGWGCSKDTFTLFPLDGFVKIAYSDTTTASYDTGIIGVFSREEVGGNVPCNLSSMNMGESFHVNMAGVIETKTNVSTIFNCKRGEKPPNDLVPLIIKLNVETTAITRLNENDHLHSHMLNRQESIEVQEKNMRDPSRPIVRNFMRKQRVSYRSKKPLLSNWRVDKTIRFVGDNLCDKKFHVRLTEDNVENPVFYDSLDMEIEYIGDFSSFEESLYVLFELLFPKDFRTFNIAYNRVNDYMTNCFKTPLANVSAEVDIVSNEFMFEENLADYVYKEKFDGEHVSLVSFNNTIYEYTKKYFKPIFVGNTSFPFFFIDCEKVVSKKQVEKQNENTVDKIIANHDEHVYEESLLKKHGDTVSDDSDRIIFSVFDCLVANDKWLNNEPYLVRLKHGKEVGDELTTITGMEFFCPKCFSFPAKKVPRKNIVAKLMQTVNTRTHSAELPEVEIDGLILQKITTPFINGKIFKLKSSELLTTDFLLKWVGDKSQYYLYLIGKPNEVLRSIPLENPLSEKHNGYRMEGRVDPSLILFDNPFFPNSHVFSPDTSMHVFSSEPHQGDRWKNGLEMLSEMVSSPMKFDGKIVELSMHRYAQHMFCWIPLRVRHDKINPNGYRIGLSNIQTIFGRSSDGKPQPKETTHTRTVQIKQRIKEMGMNKNNPINILVRMAPGDDLDGNILDCLMVKRLYYVCSDKSTLVKNFNRLTQPTYVSDVTCVWCNDPSGMFDELIVTNFMPKSIHVFIDTCSDDMPQEQLSSILDVKGFVVKM